MTPFQRPFRFGLIVETGQTTRQALFEQARRAEDAGCSIILGTDHFGRLSTLPMLQAGAQATNLRIGTLVLNNDFRHPVVLVQDLAALDVLTEGRLEIGLGAGWDKPEYAAGGMTFDPAGQRVDRLIASVGMLKQALENGRIERAADGAYPAISLPVMPRSFQRPYPPFLIGGGGRRMLSFAAREANIVGLDPRALPEGGHDPTDVTAAAIDRKIGWVREAAGDRWASLEINIIVFEVVSGNGRPAGASVGRTYGLGAEELRSSPHYLSTDAAEMTEQLLARRERWGISYFVLRPSQLEAVAPAISRLAGS
ncbi:MAG TPA: TIGR03621 family F420-dependent LLM class oxidoreductase [Candidatus Limnocylindria bacterium]|nr:TIGR03621 family F420-dependent LLM class oxidoreductase [Candidatus Limnocylindria bacterium]